MNQCAVDRQFLSALTSGLGRLSVTSRIWIVAVSVAAPITVMMLFLMVTGINHDIAFSEAELAGNRYQRPLEELLHHIPEHRAQAAAQRAGAAAADTRPDTERAIDTAFEALESVHTADGAGLQFTQDGLAQRKREHLTIPQLRREWTALRGAPSDEGYTHLIGDVRGMIAHAGDTSNLILDPDLDSYYTMDVTLLALPQTQDRLGQMIALGYAALGADATAEHRARLPILAAMLQEADHDRIAADIQTAINEDVNFGGISDTLRPRLTAAFTEYSNATRAFVAATPGGDAGGPGISPPQYAELGSRARAASLALWRVAADELDRLLQTRVDAFKRQRIVGLLLTSVAIACSGLLVLLIGRSITVPLERTSDALSQTAAEIAAASDQLASSAQALSSGATAQALALERTSETINGIAGLATGNAERSKLARELMTRFSQHADHSNALLQEMVRSMEAIRESSGGIARIIRTIDEIAFQTNVLSLNAAVEAARAGTAGAGFGVVADEVRTLAGRSADAAHETGVLIEDSRAAAKNGTDQVSLVVTSVAEVIAHLQQMRALVDDIDAASREQASGVRDVASGVTRVEQGVQGASATAEETAAASEELAAQAATARSFVEDLRTAIRGSDSTTRYSAGESSRTSRPIAARGSAKTRSTARQRSRAA